MAFAHFVMDWLCSLHAVAVDKEEVQSQPNNPSPETEPEKNYRCEGKVLPETQWRGHRFALFLFNLFNVGEAMWSSIILTCLSNG